MSGRPMPPASAVLDRSLLGLSLDRLRQPGLWRFTVTHGDLETPEDADRHRYLVKLAQRTGHLIATEGTNDTTTWIFDQQGGRIAVLAMQAEAVMIGPHYWRTETSFGTGDDGR